MIRFQTETIDCFDHGSSRSAKAASQFLHFLIKWLLQDIIIYISHQMNQTFLLYTFD